VKTPKKEGNKELPWTRARKKKKKQNLPGEKRKCFFLQAEKTTAYNDRGWGKGKGGKVGGKKFGIFKGGTQDRFV